MAETLYVLYESSLGYGLFEVEEFEEIGSEESTVQVRSSPPAPASRGLGSSMAEERMCLKSISPASPLVFAARPHPPVSRIHRPNQYHYGPGCRDTGLR